MKKILTVSLVAFLTFCSSFVSAIDLDQYPSIDVVLDSSEIMPNGQAKSTALSMMAVVSKTGRDDVLTKLLTNKGYTESYSSFVAELMVNGQHTTDFALFSLAVADYIYSNPRPMGVPYCVYHQDHQGDILICYDAAGNIQYFFVIR